MALHKQDGHRSIDVNLAEVPSAKRESLSRYYHFLDNNLSFPFQAIYREPVSPTKDVTHDVKIVALCAPSRHLTNRGLVCRAIYQKKVIEVPLVEVEVAPESPNFRLIEKYWAWAWNNL